MKSFFPLEKKLFFFFPGAEPSVCVGLSTDGWQQDSAADGPGSGPESRAGFGSGLDVRVISLGDRSVLSAESGGGASDSGGGASSRRRGPGGSDGDEQVPYRRE